MTTTKPRRPIASGPPPAGGGSGGPGLGRRLRRWGRRARIRLARLRSRRVPGASRRPSRPGAAIDLRDGAPGGSRQAGNRRKTDVANPAARGERRPAAGSRPRAEVHPRIARRRAEVAAAGPDEPEPKRSFGRVLRWALLGTALAGTAVAALLFSPLADLDQLEVRGVTDEPARVVREASRLTPGTAMFGIRASEVRGRLESIGWVAHVDVQVLWPDTVAVEVTPHRPVGVLDGGSGRGAAALLTASGHLLEPDEAGPLEGFATGLPSVGLPASESRQDRELAAGVLGQLRPVTAGALESIDLGDGSGLTLRIDARALPDNTSDSPDPDGEWLVEVALGDAADLPAKALAIESVLSGTVERACMERVDVSVPTRVTIRRAAGCTIPGGTDPDGTDPEDTGSDDIESDAGEQDR